VFNILGPLTNPAGARSQVLGAADGSLLEKMALVLKSLGCGHALVVHGEDGLDEVTNTAKTDICELKDGRINSYAISPENFGLSRASLDSLKGGTAEQNATRLRGILTGATGPARDVVLMNASAALLAGDRVASLGAGIDLAREAIDSGRARAKLEQLIKLTQSFAQST
jgi:anthranilate phosphoribosyltransferase